MVPKQQKAVLVYVLTDILKTSSSVYAVHYRKIYQALPHETESIMISQWVKYDETLNFSAEEAEMEKIMSAIHYSQKPQSRNEYSAKQRKQLFMLKRHWRVSL